MGVLSAEAEYVSVESLLVRIRGRSVERKCIFPFTMGLAKEPSTRWVRTRHMDRIVTNKGGVKEE